MNFFTYKKHMLLLISSVILVISVAIILNYDITSVISDEKKSFDASSLSPEEVVKEYYKAWSASGFEDQYSFVAESFKQQEPSASDIRKFTSYMRSFFGAAHEITVIEVSLTYFDGRRAKVGYRIKVKTDENEEIFPGIQYLELSDDGWKLIAPYGSIPKPEW